MKDAVMHVGGKGFLLFARLQPDTPGKLLAHSLSFEGLEVGSYELIRRVAERQATPTSSRQRSGSPARSAR